MATPTLSQINAAAATALQATSDAGQANGHATGLDYIGHGVAPGDDPTTRTVLTRHSNQIALLLEAWVQGLVIDQGGLDVSVHSHKRYRIGSTIYAYTYAADTTLTDDATNYIYLTTGGVVAVHTAAFPADTWHCAVVVCAAGDITSVADARMENMQVGIGNAWSAVAATQNVDMDGNGLEDLLYTEMTAPTELTIAAGSITPTQEWHTVDGEGDAADTLTTIVADAATVGRTIMLQLENVARPITISSTGTNFEVDSVLGEFDLITGTQWIKFFQHTATEWIEVGRSTTNLTTLLFDLSANGKNLSALGELDFGPSTKTIAAGAFAATKTLQRVATEAAAATDDLDSVTSANADEGTLLLIHPVDDGNTVVVKHAVGADLFELPHGLDYPMGIVGGGGTDATKYHALCKYDGTQWVEIARSHWEPKSMIIASAKERDSIPYPLVISISGALSAGVNYIEVTAVEDFVIKNASGHVGTAPSGGPAIFDVQVNAASIFAADAERINITDGLTTDTSADKWTEVSQGDLLRVEVLATGGSPNGAADLTVTVNGRIACKDVSP